MAACQKKNQWYVLWFVVTCISLGILILFPGCGSSGPAGLGPGGNSNGSSTPLGYGGNLTGKASSTISSSGETGNTLLFAKRTAKTSLGSAKITDATITFKTINGDPLTDANGNPYPPITLNADSTFQANNLPLGIDFMVEIDVNGDGKPEMSTIVCIPKDANADTGTASGLDINPLATLAVAKLIGLNQELLGADHQMDFSSAAVVAQMIRAFTTLFETMGIDSKITLDQINAMSREELIALFEKVVPDNVKATMDMAASRARLSRSTTVDEKVLAVIPALLRAGMIIADDQQGLSLDSIANLPNVEIVTWQDFVKPDPSGNYPPPPPNPPRFFRSKVVEVDRNRVVISDNSQDAQGRQFVLHKNMLERIAELEMQGKALSLRELYTLTTDLDTGLAMRLGFCKPVPPNPDNIPTIAPMYLQSSDQRGFQINLQEFEGRISALSQQMNPQQYNTIMAQIRSILKDTLSNTQAPSMETIFGNITSDTEYVTVEKLAAKIQNAQSFVPFNRSGDDKFYVMADADRFQGNMANPVTVNAEFKDDGSLSKVTYIPDGSGKYYLRGGMLTPQGYFVELILVFTGRMVFSKNGEPIRTNVKDTSIFQPVNGKTFFEAFSKTGESWPLRPALTVPNPQYDPSLPANPQTNPPTFLLTVLVTKPGVDGEIVKVSVNTDGTVVRDTAGSYALEMFWQIDPVNAMRAMLINIQNGQRVMANPGVPHGERVIDPLNVTGLEVKPEVYTQVYDTQIPNPMYNPQADPYYDDINDNGIPDAGEPTFCRKEQLWKADDWRSTCVEIYYRRADNKPLLQTDIAFDSDTPKTHDGVDLIPRNFKRRFNAFTFGRPNSAISLLTTFLDKDFFDGTHKLNGDTRISPFGAIAIINLVFDARRYNLEAYVSDFGPNGPMPAKLQMIEAWPWTPPMQDPVSLIIRGFEDLSKPASQVAGK